MLRGQIHTNLPPEHPIKLLETIEFQMAAVSPKKSQLSDLSKGRRKNGRGGRGRGGGG